MRGPGLCLRRVTSFRKEATMRHFTTMIQFAWAVLVLAMAVLWHNPLAAVGFLLMLLADVATGQFEARSNSAIRLGALRLLGIGLAFVGMFRRGGL